MKLKTLNIKFKKIILILLMLTVLGFIFMPLAFAQSFDVGIYPPIIQAQMTPPARINIPIYLQNYKDESIKLNINLRPFKNTKLENGTLEFINNDSFIDPMISNKIIVLENNQQINEINLLPKEKKKLTLLFNFPKEQPWGEYYLSLVFLSNSQSPGGSTSSFAIGGVASNILLTMGPTGKTTGILEEFSSPKFVSKSPLLFTVRVKNTGKHFITPTGNITITNIFDQFVGKIKLLEVNILPNSTRRIPDEQQAQNNQKVQELIKKIASDNKNPVAIWPKTFLLGIYKADLALSLSENGPIFKKQIHFFAFPVELIISVSLTLIIIVFIVNKVRTKLRQN